MVHLPDNGPGDQQPVADERKTDSAEAAAPCPGCGWQPEVVEVTEVLVYSRAQWEQILSAEHLRRIVSHS
jgi:hypothetical protein